MSDDTSSVVIAADSSGSPMLMIVADHRFTDEGVRLLRAAIEERMKDKQPLIISGAKVYQLLDGRWQPLETKA